MTRLTFSGHINEHSDFSQAGALSGRVVFDLEQVQRVNSSGVLLWVRFLQGLTDLEELVFVRCSMAIVVQMNLMPEFMGTARVDSFFAPYVCERTGESDLRLLQVAELDDLMLPPTYEGEDGVYELDDLPDRYFAFLLAV
ncbi:MAG: hypothetical protein H6707_09475 [Deltaproteobacteria bacterium]|nr:hypothetical protein [Deltaproteobacteria bacterium]